MGRGVTSNTTAVAIPIAITIFATDVLKSMKDARREAQALQKD